MNKCKFTLFSFQSIKILLVVIFGLFNLITLTHYGYTWDELDALKPATEFLNFFPGKIQQIPFNPYGVFFNVIGVLSQSIFNSSLHILPSDASFHLPIIILAIIFLWFLLSYIKNLLGSLVAIFSSLFLILLPRFIAHFHQNIKDVPCALLFSFSILFYYKAITSNKIKYWFIAAISFGASLAIKINAVQIPIIIFCWLVFYNCRFLFISYKIKRSNLRLVSKKVLNSFIYFGGSISFGLFIAFLLWPSIWNHPLTSIKMVFYHFNNIIIEGPILYYGKQFISGVNTPWHYAFGMILATTPFITLLFAIFGIFISFKKFSKNFDFSVLLLLWLFIPMFKYIYPKMIVYDDIRHFFEVLIPLTIFSGIGISYFIQNFRYHVFFLSVNIFKKIIICSLIIYLLFPIIKLHPYEMIYYSEIVGTESNVYKNNLFDIDFWCISYKEAAAWFYKNLPNGTRIAIPLCNHIAKYYLTGDNIVYSYEFNQSSLLLLLNRKSFIKKSVTDYIKDKEMVYSLKRNNVPLFWIYKLNN